jgi:hypothetical protein
MLSRLLRKGETMRRIRLLLVPLAAAAATPAAADRVTDIGVFAERLETDAKLTDTVFAASSQTAAAMFEAANAIHRRYQPLLGLPRAARPASAEVAILVAARDVLASAYPDKAATIRENFGFAIDQARAAPDTRAEAERIGAEAARLALARGRLDPAVQRQQYRPLTSAGTYVSTSIPVFDPWYQAMRPWAIGRVDGVRPPPPPALTSETYTRDLNEVQALGRADSTVRTPHQTMIAKYRNTPDMMPTIARIADRPGRRLVDNARLLALLWIAEYDQRLAMADAKMHYMFWRPLTAIRNADRDDNPATTRDAGWTPLLPTPNHPEYPCGHCGRAGAWAEILKAEVGDRPEGGVVVSSLSLPDALPSRLDSFDAWVREVEDSRTYAGLHYRFSDVAGTKIGRDSARAALNLMQPLPRR